MTNRDSIATRIATGSRHRDAHGHRAIPVNDSLAAVRELFHVPFWLGHTYGRIVRPASGLAFDIRALLKSARARSWRELSAHRGATSWHWLTRRAAAIVDRAPERVSPGAKVQQPSKWAHSLVQRLLSTARNASGVAGSWYRLSGAGNAGAVAV